MSDDAEYVQDLQETLEFYSEQMQRMEKKQRRSEKKNRCVDCRDEMFQTCPCCSKKICNTCYYKGPNLVDWLKNVENQCETCNSIVCSKCFRLCLDCVNEREVAPLICKNCPNNLVKVPNVSRIFRYKCIRHANNSNHLKNPSYCSHPMD